MLRRFGLIVVLIAVRLVALALAWAATLWHRFTCTAAETIGVLLVVGAAITLPTSIYWLFQGGSTSWRAWALLVASIAVPFAYYRVQIDGTAMGRELHAGAAAKIERWIRRRLGIEQHLDGPEGE
ncbi:MAG: hypothetical protein R3B49_04540 [Phycisphaerales bacterium]